MHYVQLSVNVGYMFWFHAWRNLLVWSSKSCQADFEEYFHLSFLWYWWTEDGNLRVWDRGRIRKMWKNFPNMVPHDCFANLKDCRCALLCCNKSWSLLPGCFFFLIVVAKILSQNHSLQGTNVWSTSTTFTPLLNSNRRIWQSLFFSIFYSSEITLTFL